MRTRALGAAALFFLVWGCATTAPRPVQPDALQGVASWYGEEFAGRTTANGEIFDPLLLTAAHRTLPFGTVLDVTNPKTGQTVRVRINDRGPYIGNRIIDLSYAAAQQISLIEPGSGMVDLKVVKVGRGDREPPAPYVVKTEQPARAAGGSEAPKVPFPLPSGGTVAPSGTSPDEFTVQVTEERHGVPTRRQVAADGRTIESVPIPGAEPAPPVSAPGHSAAERLDSATVPKPVATVGHAPGFVVQVGAFSVEANAVALQRQLAAIGQAANVEFEQPLYRVRIGPFPTREAAVRVRTALESHGMSAIIVTE